MSHSTESRKMTFGIKLKSNTPRPVDTVGHFGPLPVLRVSVLKAQDKVRAARNSLTFAKANAVVAAVAAGNEAIGFVLTDWPDGKKPTGKFKLPLHTDTLAALGGTPYTINFSVQPLWAHQFAQLLDNERSPVFKRFVDLAIACEGLCGFTEQDISETPRPDELADFFKIRDKIAKALASRIAEKLVKKKKGA